MDCSLIPIIFILLGNMSLITNTELYLSAKVDLGPALILFFNYWSQRSPLSVSQFPSVTVKRGENETQAGHQRKRKNIVVVFINHIM